MKKRVLSLLVVNSSGVLSRVSGMFSRRGYNIDSLTVGVTENPKYSRMTVVVSGDDRTLDQIEKQLYKLEDVINVTELKDGQSVCRELVLVKVKADKTEKQQIIADNPELRDYWDDEVGDRETRLCIIGRHMDKDAVVAALDACLTDWHRA